MVTSAGLCDLLALNVRTQSNLMFLLVPREVRNYHPYLLWLSGFLEVGGEGGHTHFVLALVI